MELKIVERERDGVVILELRSSVDRGDQTMRQAVEKHVASGKNRIIFQMEGVTHVTSSDVGIYVVSMTACRKAGGDLKLVKVPPVVHEVLRITRLITMFQIFDSEDEAIAAFHSASPKA